MPRLKSQSLLEVQAKIEDAALARFVRRGFAGTSTREIAEAAGMTAGALYVHYPSKEVLFARVVERYRARFQSEENPLSQVLARTRFPDDLEALARAIGALVRTHRDYWKLWYVDVLEFDGKHFRSELTPQALIKSPALKRRLRELRAQKRLRVDPEQAFILVYMDLFNYFLVEVLFGARDHLGVPERDAVRAMVEVHLHGLLAPPSRG
jgi:AcrR family transcriptional regulator